MDVAPRTRVETTALTGQRVLRVPHSPRIFSPPCHRPVDFCAVTAAPVVIILAHALPPPPWWSLILRHVRARLFTPGRTTVQKRIPIRADEYRSVGSERRKSERRYFRARRKYILRAYFVHRADLRVENARYELSVADERPDGFEIY